MEPVNGEPVKLRDLAQRLGVHPSTVSRVLSGDPSARLSEATRSRILDVARATGYRPNRLARSLKIQRTLVLGMVIPDITNPFFSGLFRAVEDAAGDAGYSVILCNTDDSDARFEQHLRVLGEGHVDGLLIAAVHRRDTQVDMLLRARGIPFVLVNRRRDDPDDWWVIPDDRAGARTAVDYLHRLGHRRIAHIAGATDISTTATRVEAFREGLAARGILDERLIVTGGLAEEGGQRGMEQLLRLPSKLRPTAAFVANDFAALGAMAVARRAGVRVPEDLSIVGYNDAALAARSEPPLTTLHVPIPDMGRIATELLIRRLTAEVDSSNTPVQVTLPVELVVRGSAAPPATVAMSA